MQQLGMELWPLPACGRRETEAGNANPPPWLPLPSLSGDLSKTAQQPRGPQLNNGAFVLQQRPLLTQGFFAATPLREPRDHRWGDPARGGGGQRGSALCRKAAGAGGAPGGDRDGRDTPAEQHPVSDFASSVGRLISIKLQIKRWVTVAFGHSSGMPISSWGDNQGHITWGQLSPKERRLGTEFTPLPQGQPGRGPRSSGCAPQVFCAGETEQNCP